MSSTSPSTLATCRILNRNSCGSGTVVGVDDVSGEGIVLSNAHVTSSQIGRQVTVEVESQNRKRYQGRVTRAAYSNSVSADWSLIRVPGLVDVKPVYLSRDPLKEGESCYTKGFPRCQPMQSGNIEPRYFNSNGVVLWTPNAIGGQSGSGVFSDIDNYVKALLTWSMTRGRTWYGAGQATSEIWRQNRDYKLTGGLRAAPRVPGWTYKELNEDCVIDWDTTGLDDPVVEEGFFSEPLRMGVQEEPIWSFMFEDSKPDPDPEPDPDNPLDAIKLLKSLNSIKDFVEDEAEKWEGVEGQSPTLPDNDDDEDLLFGL